MPLGLPRVLRAASGKPGSPSMIEAERHQIVATGMGPSPFVAREPDSERQNDSMGLPC